MTYTNRRADDASDRPLRTRADFAAELDALVTRAREAGVDLSGAYDVRSLDGRPEYTIEISTIVKRSDRSLIE